MLISVEILASDSNTVYIPFSGKSALPLFKNGAIYVSDFDILELYGRGKVINLKKRGIGYWGLVSKVV